MNTPTDREKQKNGLMGILLTRLSASPSTLPVCLSKTPPSTPPSTLPVYLSSTLPVCLSETPASTLPVGLSSPLPEFQH